MTGRLTFQQFADLTREAGEDQPYLPTFADPANDIVRVLEGVPESAEAATVVGDWAAGLECEHYFLAYPQGEAIMAEEYDCGSLVASLLIRPNENSKQGN